MNSGGSATAANRRAATLLAQKEVILQHNTYVFCHIHVVWLLAYTMFGWLRPLSQPYRLWQEWDICFGKDFQ
ncbi:hypothetical protein INR49_014407 [Caranx melampygus]|nr:hypothetical protein INR49_014407 [Caranx melampygus]